MRDLTVDFKLEHGVMRAVDGVGFDVRRGEVLGIVGESGSGKSQILLAAMGLTAVNGRCSGSVTFEGEEILNAPPEQLDQLRGSSMSMIFQDPMTSLNPVHARARPAGRGADGAPGQEPQAEAVRHGDRDAGARAHSRCAAAASRSIRTSSPAACASA